jgi:hypothetical protein
MRTACTGTKFTILLPSKIFHNFVNFVNLRAIQKVPYEGSAKVHLPAVWVKIPEQPDH